MYRRCATRRSRLQQRLALHTREVAGSIPASPTLRLSPPRPGARAIKLFNALTGTQKFLHRLSGGRIAGRWKGRNPILLLDHVGARSGQRRTTPIVYTEHEGDLILVASRGGTQNHPGWFYN